MPKISEQELQQAIIVVIRYAIEQNKKIIAIQQLGVSLEKETPTNWEFSCKQI
jgi:hypothetical protein